MATKKYIELQDFSDPELNDELKQTEAQYQKMSFDHAIKGLDNPILLKEVRRDIARLKTEVRRRELAALGDEGLASRDRIRARRRRK